ncbi:MAG: hypothetical protein M0P61_00330 [Ignavibacteriaceae bacterium]|jgi:hypothetical protein|nr:hypothetical protein [Ignavibacteriaceae bacterium]
MELREKVKLLLNTWIQTEDGTGTFKLTGPYWEVLYPILKKHEPDLLKQYENKLQEVFENFNEEIREKVSSGDEEQDYVNAINYMNAREKQYANNGDVHYVDNDGDDYAYIPNVSIDQNEHFGREV